jgi:hypothetical protein
MTSSQDTLLLQQSHAPLFGDLPKPHRGFYPQFQVWSPILTPLNVVHYLCASDESRRTASNFVLISVAVFPSK